MRQKQWARHYQADWAERSGNTRLPDWLRVVALAYGKHKANGHAAFKRGEIAWVLAKVDEDSGEIVAGRNVHRAVAAAVDYGFLSPLSNQRCLVVPVHAIGGPSGNVLAPCPIHGDV